jgi:hypothetical protein
MSGGRGDFLLWKWRSGGGVGQLRTNRLKTSNNLFEILHPLSEGIYTDRQFEESAGLVHLLFDGTFLFGKA